MQTRNSGDTSDESTSELLEGVEEESNPSERARELRELIARYDTIDDEKTRKEIRLAYLRSLEKEASLVRDDEISSFLATHVKSDDFADLDWDSPESVVEFSETLFKIRFDDEEQAKCVRDDVNVLLRHVLRGYEEKRDYESMFLLLKYAPTLSTMSDAELFRLRHRSYLYEMRRVERNKRIIYAYLVVHVVLVLVVFPILFVSAENGRLQHEIEEVAKVDLKPEPARNYTYTDGVYWSLVTAASIGYGDITPVTRIGRIMAAILGVLGVITVGVIAGLILQWVTPRPLD
jgi:hypothetical protein